MVVRLGKPFGGGAGAGWLAVGLMAQGPATVNDQCGGDAIARHRAMWTPKAKERQKKRAKV